MQLELSYGPTVTADGVSLGLWSRWTNEDGFFLCMSSHLCGASLAAGKLAGEGWSWFDTIDAAAKSAPLAAKMLGAMSLGVYLDDQPGVH